MVGQLQEDVGQTEKHRELFSGRRLSRAGHCSSETVVQVGSPQTALQAALAKRGRGRQRPNEEGCGENGVGGGGGGKGRRRVGVGVKEAGEGG